jgi:hypothetical protein
MLEYFANNFACPHAKDDTFRRPQLDEHIRNPTEHLIQRKWL